MKHVKMLGIAAVLAAALMALIGAGAAQAETTLCKVTEDACSTANMYPVGTAIAATATEPAVLKAGFATITCNKSTVAGKTETTTTPEGKNSTLSFSECGSATVTTLNPGKLQIHWDAEHNGNLTTSGVEVKVEVLGVSCVYGGEVKSGLTLTGGNPATLDAVEANIPKVSGGILCGNPAKWTAHYEITSPKPLFVSKGL
jgi:hypothetical protein